jgi:hypothetical protein
MSLTGIGEVANLATGIINKIWPDKSQQEKDAMAFQMQQAIIESDLVKGQLAVNQAEAANTNIFVAGWRPAVGWSCAFTFGWSYVLCPMLTWVSALLGHPVSLPALDMSEMMPVLLGMLGLGGMRTTEKLKGVSNGH